MDSIFNQYCSKKANIALFHLSDSLHLIGFHTTEENSFLYLDSLTHPDVYGSSQSS